MEKTIWIRSLAGPNLKSKIQNLKLVGIVALAVAFAMCGAVANAQQTKKLPRIGYLTTASASTQASRLEAFRQGLREHGYMEGKNIVIEYRYAEGKLDYLPALAAELIRLKVDAIVTAGSTPTRAVKEATATIPIVMAFDSDPVANGFVASLARPGGNITGLSALSPELSGKRLELLKEIIPKLSRVAALGNSTNPSNAQSLRETELAAGALAVKLQYLDVLGPKDIETAFRAATKGHADAVLVLVNPVVNFRRKQIADLAIKSRLPAIYFSTEFVEEGGAYELRCELYRLVPACRCLRGQDPERHKTGRSPRGTADEV